MTATVLFVLFGSATVMFALATYLERPAPSGQPSWTLWAAAIAAACAISCAPEVFH